MFNYRIYKIPNKESLDLRGVNKYLGVNKKQTHAKSFLAIEEQFKAPPYKVGPFKVPSYEVGPFKRDLTKKDHFIFIIYRKPI